MGFPYNASRDQVEGQVSDHSQWGMPYCTQWWSDPSNGLYHKLITALPESFIQETLPLSNQQMLESDGIRNLIHHTLFDPGMNAGEISRGYESLNDDNSAHGWLSHIATDAGATVGTYYENMKFSPKLQLLIDALPVIQALLLMAIYALLALMIPFASYRVSFIVTGTAVIFAITFWSYLWQWVHYFDNDLLAALYPNSSEVDGYFQGHSTHNEMLVSMIIGSLYVGLPILFLMMSSWAGLKIGGVIGSLMSSMGQPAESAVSNAGAMGGKMIGSAGSLAVRGGIKAAKGAGEVAEDVIEAAPEALL